MDTLAFSYILPTTGRIRDFNPLETCAARRTRRRADNPLASRHTDYRLFLLIAFSLTPIWSTLQDRCIRPCGENDGFETTISGRRFLFEK